MMYLSVSLFLSQKMNHDIITLSDLSSVWYSTYGEWGVICLLSFFFSQQGSEQVVL